MKINILKLFSIAILAVLFTMGVSCCKKDNNNNNNNKNSQGYGTIIFHMHTQFDTTEMATVSVPYGPGDPSMWGSVETGGRQIRLKFAQMEISQVRLNEGNSAAGPYYDIPDFSYVKSVDSEPYTISTHVPYNTYISPAYSIGLPADTNDLNPNSFPSGSYLGSNYLDMWTGNTSTGYWWIKFEGWVDTSQSGTDSAMCPFNFSISSANTPGNLPMQIVLPPRGSTAFPSYPPLNANNPSLTMHNIINYAYLFTGITLKGANRIQLSTLTNPSLATQIVKNATVVGPLGSKPTNHFIVYEE